VLDTGALIAADRGKGCRPRACAHQEHRRQDDSRRHRDGNGSSLDAVIVTGDVADFGRLAAHFPGVTLLVA
jgi:hypothetical protein